MEAEGEEGEEVLPLVQAPEREEAGEAVPEGEELHTQVLARQVLLLLLCPKPLLVQPLLQKRNH